MKFSQRQEEIIKLVKEGQPITSENLAEKLGVTRAALRADLAILTMTGTLDARPKVGYVYLGRKTNGDVLENLLKIRAGDVMSKPVTVNENTMVYDAIVYLFLNDVGTLFVENNDALVEENNTEENEVAENTNEVEEITDEVAEVNETEENGEIVEVESEDEKGRKETCPHSKI